MLGVRNRGWDNVGLLLESPSHNPKWQHSRSIDQRFISSAVEESIPLSVSPGIVDSSVSLLIPYNRRIFGNPLVHNGHRVGRRSRKNRPTASYTNVYADHLASSSADARSSLPRPNTYSKLSNTSNNTNTNASICQSTSGLSYRESDNSNGVTFLFHPPSREASSYPAYRGALQQHPSTPRRALLMMAHPKLMMTGESRKMTFHTVLRLDRMEHVHHSAGDRLSFLLVDDDTRLEIPPCSRHDRSRKSVLGQYLSSGGETQSDVMDRWTIPWAKIITAASIGSLYPDVCLAA